jgi:hypothetical protein
VFQFTAAARDFSLFQSFETISEAHPVSYSMGNGNRFSGDKAAAEFK